MSVIQLKNNSKNKIAKFRRRQEPICFYCGRRIKYKVTVDHLTSIANGGTNSNSNLVIACFRCNSEKASMNFNQYIKYLKYKQYLKKLDIQHLEEKQEIFVDILRNKSTSAYLRGIVISKIKAVKMEKRDRKRPELTLSSVKNRSLIRNKRIHKMLDQKNGLIKKSNSEFFNYVKNELLLSRRLFFGSNSFDELINNLEKFLNLVVEIKNSDDRRKKFDRYLDKIIEYILELLDEIELFLHDNKILK